MLRRSALNVHTRHRITDAPLVVVVDFDGVIADSAYPDIGETDRFVIGCLRVLRANGARIVLNTCREGAPLREAISHCAAEGLVFDAVNENMDHLIARWGDCRKLGGDIYIDDRDICFSRRRMRLRLWLLSRLYPHYLSFLRR